VDPGPRNSAHPFWIFADSISVRRSHELHAGSCVVLHCGRAVSRNRRGNGEVLALGLGCLSGIVSVTLRVMLLAQMPASSVWFIGFALGVDMIVDGGSLVGFATALHGLPALPVYGAA
jgi:hypothetical protein